MKKVSPTWTEIDLEDGFGALIDEIARALQRDAGLPASSPLPGTSKTASRHGGQRQSRGYSIPKLALDIGSISDSVGQLAAEERLSFGAREYQVFNQCIDTAIASALEQFWSQSREQQENGEAERLGFLAHELRNALASARAAFVILRRGQVGVNSRTGDVLERGLTRLENLVGQALVAVHLHAPVELDAKRIPVAKMLREVVDAVVPGRGIVVRVDSSEMLVVTADEKLLVSAIGNLFDNALKFTKSGGTVVLRGREDGGTVVIEVEDECGGLPPGRPDELFVPFVQRGSDRRGLGLGLAIATKAAKAHSGGLSVENLPGKGCIFALSVEREPSVEAKK
jgi:signal transduction histidine kinase